MNEILKKKLNELDHMSQRHVLQMYNKLFAQKKKIGLNYEDEVVMAYAKMLLDDFMSKGD
jgi:hypothetical protein